MQRVRQICYWREILFRDARRVGELCTYERGASLHGLVGRKISGGQARGREGAHTRVLRRSMLLGGRTEAVAADPLPSESTGVCIEPEGKREVLSLPSPGERAQREAADVQAMRRVEASRRVPSHLL